jgi:hypothetical protein
MKSKPVFLFLLLALLCAVLIPLRAGAGETGTATLVGTWTAEAQGVRVRVVFGADGTFARTMTDSSGTATVRGQYLRQGSMLMVQPQGQMPMQFTIRDLQGDRLVLVGMDGSVLEMARAATGAPHGTAPPSAPRPPAKAVPAANFPVPAAGGEPAAAPPARPATGNALVPDWVRPGLRLTYYLHTGSVSGSVNGYVLDEDGNITDRNGNRYSTERQGHSSQGLVEATVAGMDAQIVAMAQPFYLLMPRETTPQLKSHMDTLVTADTGGDFWMHPQKQALMLREHPWTGAARPGQVMARMRTWRSGNQSWTATAIISMGDTGRTFWVYDQATGRLLYLSRISRHAPDIRDPAQSLPDSVSYATFLRFVDAHQLNLPWLNTPMPDWTRQLQALSYQGRMSVQFPGAAPGGGTMLSQQMEVSKRGGDWLLFQSRSQTQGLPAVSGSNSVTGPGCLPPVIIPPAALGRLRPGQEIDRDPHTGITVRVAAADAQSVTLEADGPRQSFMFVYDRAQGVMIHSLSRERSTAGTNMVVVHEMQLAGKR